MTARNDADRFESLAIADAAGSVSHISGDRAAMRRTPQKIALFGLFGSGNLGNEGSLEAMVEFLRRERPDAELSCICREPEVVKKTFTIETLPIRRNGPAGGLAGRLNRLCLRIPAKLADFARAFGHVRKADVMIIPGTGILDDFGERPAGMPYDILKWCLAARLAGTRIAFVSIGAGPIRNRLSRLLMISAARLAHYRSYRDLQSKEFMEKVGFDASNDAVYPDLAFGLPAPAPLPRTVPSVLRVGVGVMAYRGWYGFADGGQPIFCRYIGKLAEFVAHVLDSGHEVRLLTGDDDDSIAIDALRAAVRKLRPGAMLAHAQVNSLGDVMAQMALTDIVIATRFHNIVCALKMCRPTISLGYARKNDVLMERMGLGEYCQHIETFNVDTLVAHFSRLTADTEKHEQAISVRLAEFRANVTRQDACLLSSVIG
ncbi:MULTISPECIES: polysaccharide pyruvyl transferase family protein [unclassified Mesorhizobium]|uniref:polysaccharide pyruvyl transferase family protein n=1 Tax=unclassified Mesorhizobium TaxID=325217 RepID=UPI001FDF7C28|nr:MULTISPECIES: polysaccharide pyruvyl transferase family protein [unclassified Mesorhizobium]